MAQTQRRWEEGNELGLNGLWQTHGHKKKIILGVAWVEISESFDVWKDSESRSSLDVGKNPEMRAVAWTNARTRCAAIPVCCVISETLKIRDKQAQGKFFFKLKGNDEC